MNEWGVNTVKLWYVAQDDAEYSVHRNLLTVNLIIKILKYLSCWFS